MGLLAELKRRNVIRMASLYLVGAWLLTQVASTVLPLYDAPSWVTRAIVTVLAIGFIPALVFSWVFELTPEGFKRDAEVTPERSIAPQTARRMDRLIMLGLALALAYFGFDKFVLAPRREAALVAATSQSMAAAASSQAKPAVSDKSIAVLPFADLSPGGDQAYFSDGMAEEILDTLAKVEDLKVAGRTSSFYFRGRNEKLQAIGAELGVANVLEGSVRTQGNKVRITAQLIRIQDGFHRWSESYDGDLSDVFELQERIARAIAGQLKLVLQGGQKTQLAQKATQNVEAHQQYLRGRYFFLQRGLVNLQQAEAAFQAALAADPGYADAWASLAQVYALIPEYSIFDPAGGGKVIDTWAQALDAAEHALHVDPASSRALSARAYVRMAHEFDWARAEADFQAAIAADQRDSTARQWYGDLLMFQRRWREGAVQFNAAVALDPLAPILHFDRALSHWYQGKLDAALSGFNETHRLAPDLYYPKLNRALVLVELHRYDEARDAARDLADAEREMMLAFIDATRDRTRTDAAVKEILAHGPGGLVSKATMLAMLGRHDLALSELERGFAAQDPLREYLYAVPQFDPLHKNPRFQALLQQIGLPVPHP